MLWQCCYCPPFVPILDEERHCTPPVGRLEVLECNGVFNSSFIEGFYDAILEVLHMIQVSRMRFSAQILTHVKQDSILKIFHLVGTVGSSIGSLDESITNERYNDMLSTSLSSRYSRFSTSKAEKIGTQNENSTMMALRQE